MPETERLEMMSWDVLTIPGLSSAQQPPHTQRGQEGPASATVSRPGVAIHLSQPCSDPGLSLPSPPEPDIFWGIIVPCSKNF